MDPATDFKLMTARLMVSCSALLIYLEGAFDQDGTRFVDPRFPEPSAVVEAREAIAQAKTALRLDR